MQTLPVYASDFSHQPAPATGTGRAISGWDGQNRKHNFRDFLIKALSTATVSMYIQTAE